MSDKQFVSYDDANTILSGYAEAIKNADGSNVEKATYDTTPATKPHSTDDFIYFNDTVYKVTSAIAIGDTIAVGTNITADTGLSADTQMYIDGLPGDGGGSSGGIDPSMIAGTESTSTSTHAYSTGDYFIDSQGQLCKATDDIAINDTISVGTGSGDNAVATTVGGELSELNSNSVAPLHLKITKNVDMTAEWNVAVADRFDSEQDGSCTFQQVPNKLVGTPDGYAGLLMWKLNNKWGVCLLFHYSNQTIKYYCKYNGNWTYSVLANAN